MAARRAGGYGDRRGTCLSCLSGRCVGLRRVIKIRGSPPRVSRECLRQAAAEEEGEEWEEEEERQQGR